MPLRLGLLESLAFGTASPANPTEIALWGEEAGAQGDGANRRRDEEDHADERDHTFAFRPIGDRE